ncbi:MAG TPA: hypothetical protein VFT84_08715, partial [Gemmatimonadales bacterium]|nr:hypothetical protein [Gemmatimonadales bacterium]
GRVFGAERARQWSVARRAFYAAASPLIPCVRFLRTLRYLNRADSSRPSLLRVAPVLAIGLLADGVGQLVGYLAGSGGSPRYLTGFEFGRVNFVPERDRSLWSEAAQSPSAADGSAGDASSPVSR